MSPAWVKSLFARGRRKVYRGKELHTLGMPCGGVGAGQIYLRGDGTLGQWWIFNNAWNQRHCSGYQTYRPPSPIEQGFAIRVTPEAGPARTAVLSEKDFDAIEFIGEYPIAEVRYKRTVDPLPVSVAMEVFSPWIPLNARDSANPASIVRFTLANTSDTPVEVSLAGWLQNGVCLRESMAQGAGVRRRRVAAPVAGASRNTVVREGPITGVLMDLAPPAKRDATDTARADIVFETFEGGTFDRWTVEGKAFGTTPREIAKHQHPQKVARHGGKYLADSLGPKGVYDKPTGKLTSKPFKIERRYINFRIAGGAHPGKTCMNLLVDGKVVRSAVGDNTENLKPHSWDVSDLAGRTGVLAILDAHTGGWGHVLVDQIVFSDRPAAAGGEAPTDNQAYGQMALSVLDASAGAVAAWESKETFLARFAADGKLSGEKTATYRLDTVRCGALAAGLALKPGQSGQVTFLVTWYFPNRTNGSHRVGQMYANWYRGAMDVVRYIAKNFKRLDAETHLFHKTYFDTTLPYWLVHRIGMPLANLATGTTEWWSNGQFYGWEGVMCCAGTCTHVWHYEQATGRLFPELARSTRLMQNLAEMNVQTGIIGFRGGGSTYAADGQAGVILMVYREHLMSRDGTFLAGAWPRVKRAIECMIARDGRDGVNGIVNTSDHTTYDINFEGANTHNGSMYLAALAACERMALLQGDRAAAERYRRIHQSGTKLTVKNQFNGDYFIQIIPAGKPTKWQIGTGCMTSQLLGNGWATQVNLPPVYPEPIIRKTLESIFRYNWIPDVGPHYARHKPIMVFVKPGEAGLLICTYPLGSRLKQPLMYRNTIMHGYDYDAANQMLARGMLTEGLAVYRANHDNYDGAKHNPWNEQQCGDHYARAMTAWGALIAISGFVHDGPAGQIGFSPKFKPEDFKAFFTSSWGWGSLVQKRSGTRQSSRIEVKWDTLAAGTLVFDLPARVKLARATVTAAGREVSASARQSGTRVTLKLGKGVEIPAGAAIEVVLTW